MTVMKKGTNTKMKYQQGQTRLSSQYAKTYVSLLPYQGADHLTFEAWGGGGVGLVISGQQEYVCRIFSLNRVSPGFCKNVFTFTLWLLQ